jgi:hypothetical protein
MAIMLRGGAGASERSDPATSRSTTTPEPPTTEPEPEPERTTVPTSIDSDPPPTAAEGSSPCPGATNWLQAATRVGDTTTITGRVASATYAQDTKGSPTYLNVGRPYPNPTRFVVLIWGDDRAAFTNAPEQLYKGRNLCVTGTVKTYDGVPQIIVESPASIVAY